MARHARRRLALALALLVALGALVAIGATPASGTADGVLFGAHPARRSGESDQMALARFEQDTGRKLDVVRDFVLWDSEFPNAYHSQLKDSGQPLILSVKSKRIDQTVIPFADVAAAQPGSPLYGEIVSWAQRIKAYGAPMYFTYNHEPESSASFPMGEDVEFIAAWRRVHEIFDEQGVTNVTWMWIMTDYAFWVGSNARNDGSKWYPGDDYVDAMGIDAYNWYTCRVGINNRWKSLEEIITPFRDFGAQHPDKELWLTEYASTEDPEQPGRKAEWLAEAQELFKQPDFAQFAGVSQFDYKDHAGCQWYYDSSPSALAAFRTWGDDPFYNGAAAPPPPPPRVETPEAVPSTVETTPGTHSGDTMDDPAIWVHPTDPALSLVMANDKLGAFETYDLAGNLVQRLTSGSSFWGNVDVRQGVTVGSTSHDLVGVVNGGGVRFLTPDPGTRQLAPVTEGAAPIGASGEGFCLYESPVDQRVYGIVVAIDGTVRQFELLDSDADGLVEGNVVRTFAVGSEAEGCVADDATGALYISEEDVALWRYDAEPGGGTAREAVDVVAADGGHLAADIEGVTLVEQADGGGYVVVSAQNVADPDASYFGVYGRGPGNPFVKTFRIIDGTESDDCDRTDGVAATAADLGPAFPQGVFVCQDNNNDLPGSAGNQNLKLTPLETVVDLGAPPPANQDPTAAFGVECTALVCDFDGTGSTDPEAGALTHAWTFGDGQASTEAAPTHGYAAAGDYTVTLTVTDPDGGTDELTRTVTVAEDPPPPPAPATVEVVGTDTLNQNATDFTVRVPTTAEAGDLLLLFASENNTTPLVGPGAGWTQLGRQTDGSHATTVWSRVATAADAGGPVTLDAEGVWTKAALTLAVYRGVDATDPLAAVAAAPEPGSTAAHTTPTATSADPVHRVSYWSDKTSATTGWTAPAGETVQATTTGGGGGRIGSLLTDHPDPQPAGTHGALTATATSAANKATMWTLLLRPADDPGPPPPPPPPPANQDPTAAFGVECTALVCDFDGTGSTDPEAGALTHAWTFGDGQASTEAAPTHGYAAAGDYTVTLTVTDPDGGTDELTRTVTVAEDPPPPPAPATVEVVGTDTLNQNATDFTVRVPTTAEAGDLLLLFASENNTTPLVGPGAGWTQLGRQTDGSHATTVWSRVATAADAGGPVTLDAEGVWTKAALTLAVYRGVDATDPLAAVAAAPEPGSTAAHTTPTATSADPVHRVSYWSDKTSATTGWTAPAGETVQATTTGGGGGRIGSLLTDHPDPQPAGTHGALTATATSAANKATMWTLLLRPADDPG